MTSTPRRAWGAALPATAFLACFVIVPMIVLGRNALGLTGRPGDGFTWHHLAAAFTEPSLRRSLLSSIVICTVAVLGSIVVAVPTLLAESARRRVGRPPSGLATSLMTLPIALPGIVIGFFGIVMAGRTGLTALAPGGAGLTYTALGMIVAYLYFSLPRIIGPLRGAVEALDREAIEAARVVGGSPAHVFTTVTLPLLLPAIADAWGSAMATALGGYGTVATLSEGVRLLPLDVVDALTSFYDLARACALAFVLAAVAIGFRVLGAWIAGSSDRRLRRQR